MGVTPRVSDSVGRRRGQRTCFSNKYVKDADVTGPGTTLQEPQMLDHWILKDGCGQIVVESPPSQLPYLSPLCRDQGSLHRASCFLPTSLPGGGFLGETPSDCRAEPSLCCCTKYIHRARRRETNFCKICTKIG